MEEEKKTIEYPFRYDGSLVWLVIFFIIFFPIALELLICNARIKKEDYYWGIHYKGSQFWFCFWTLVFFPIAIILGFVNGFEIIGEKA